MSRVTTIRNINIKFGLVLLAVLFSGYVMAGLAGDESAESRPAANAESMLWPMLPGESLNSLAKLFYPGNRYMQKHFVAKALELNRDSKPDITASTIFQEPETLRIPELKSLSRRYAKPRRPAKPKPEQVNVPLPQAELPVEQALEPQTQTLFDEVYAQNQALNAEIQVLDEKLANLQKLGEQLKKELELSQAKEKMAKPVQHPAQQKPLPEDTAKKAEQQKSAPPSPAEPKTSKSWVLPALLGAGLLLALACWLNRFRFKRGRTTGPEAKVIAQEENSGIHDSALDMGATQIETVHPPAPMQAGSPIQVIESIVDEAKALVEMEKSDEAIGILEGHIHALPKASLASWLYLFDIYRELGRKDEFIDLSRRFHKIFNVMVPQWEQAGVPLVTAKSLEEFPHIVSQLIQLWNNGDAKAYLERLLEDNRQGERQGFSHEVAHEIVLLLDILEHRE